MKSCTTATLCFCARFLFKNSCNEFLPDNKKINWKRITENNTYDNEKIIKIIKIKQIFELLLRRRNKNKRELINIFTGFYYSVIKLLNILFSSKGQTNLYPCCFKSKILFWGTILKILLKKNWIFFSTKI